MVHVRFNSCAILHDIHVSYGGNSQTNETSSKTRRKNTKKIATMNRNWNHAQNQEENVSNNLIYNLDSIKRTTINEQTMHRLKFFRRNQ